MFHHDSRDYAVAKSEAASRGREIMEGIIEKGRRNAGEVVQKILDQVVVDRVVRTKAVKVFDYEGKWRIGHPNADENYPIHRHAWQQLLADSGLPKLYADKLEKQANGTAWGKELIQHNLNTIFAHRDTQRNLVRETGNEVRGWLSDRYRRLDSRPLLDAFIGASMQFGLVPIEGYALDTKVRVRSVLPYVFEPVKDEVMLVGLEWGNSDYGDGGHVVNTWIQRIWCTNLAITEQKLRNIHLGKRLNDDITYSQETYRLDTETNVSALKDVVKAAIGPGEINRMMEYIGKASDQEVKGKDGVAGVLAKYLDKSDAEKAAAAFDSPDVLNLPAGNTMWRLSNAVSFIAQSKDYSPEKRLELQAIAGEMIPHKQGNVVEVGD